MKKFNVVNIIVITILLIALGFTTTLAVRYWNEVSKLGNITISIGSVDGVELTIVNISEAFNGVLVPEERKIEETKKDFFAHASHELKSPLTAILGYSELITLDMVEEKEYKDVVERIYNQAEHMSLLVEDMSTLSKLESITEKEELYEIVSLNKILKDVCYTMESFLNEKNIKLDIYEEPINYNCIELDINKLFKNLIENAIKYSYNNSVINVRLYKKNDDIIFEVEDDGIGISAEHIDRIFGRFYRIDKGRIDSGTGLGLAIVKHTVIKYHGKTDVKSAPGEGTTIKVSLKA
ncbi:MAG: HAMP domain-containing sensor histidine kinase [Acholeplasmatales bacterium]